MNFPQQCIARLLCSLVAGLVTAFVGRCYFHPGDETKIKRQASQIIAKEVPEERFVVEKINLAYWPGTLKGYSVLMRSRKDSLLTITIPFTYNYSDRSFVFNLEGFQNQVRSQRLTLLLNRELQSALLPQNISKSPFSVQIETNENFSNLVINAKIYRVDNLDPQFPQEHLQSMIPGLNHFLGVVDTVLTEADISLDRVNFTITWLDLSPEKIAELPPLVAGTITLRPFFRDGQWSISFSNSNISNLREILRSALKRVGSSPKSETRQQERLWFAGVRAAATDWLVDRPGWEQASIAGLISSVNSQAHPDNLYFRRVYVDICPEQLNEGGFCSTKAKDRLIMTVDTRKGNVRDIRMIPAGTKELLEDVPPL